MIEWLSDDRGNRNSVQHWGSPEAAQRALDGLINCDNCTNCSDCSDCSRCSGCSDCSGCSGCSDCSDCSRCSDCSDCSGCSGCSDCSDCSGCSDCSDCSGCSGCSRCSGCSGLYDQENIKAVAIGETNNGPPPVPVIENIHAKVWQAVSQPKALDMGIWHDTAYDRGECGTTHCRGGWVVALAGEEGRALEKFHNTLLAAMMIYDASDPGYRINPCRFFDPEPEALEDMRKLAGVASNGVA